MAKAKYNGAFNGKMNMDIAPELLSPEDYSYALHFENDNEVIGDKGVGGMMRGTTEVTNEYKEPGDKVIGRALWTDENAEIIFVYNSHNSESANVYSNKILIIKEGTAVTLLVKGTWLPFTSTTMLNNPVCHGDYVFWTIDEPMFLDIRRAMKREEINQLVKAIIPAASIEDIRAETIHPFKEILNTDIWEFTIFTYHNQVYCTGYLSGADIPITDVVWSTTTPQTITNYNYVCEYEDFYRLLDSDSIGLLAVPPETAPIAEYSTNVEYGRNNLYGNLFQFAYRYEYADNRRSVYSQMSDIALPLLEETSSGMRTSNIKNNGIDIKFNTGNYEVIRIEIAMVNISNPTVAKTIAILDKYDNFNDINVENGISLISNKDVYYKSFYNAEVINTIPSYWIFKTNDYIFPHVKVQEMLSDGRLLLGNMKQSDLYVKTDMFAEVSQRDISYTSPVSTPTISSHSESFTVLPYFKFDYGATTYDGASFDITIVTSYSLDLDLTAATYSKGLEFRITLAYRKDIAASWSTKLLQIPLPYDNLKTAAENYDDAITFVANSISDAMSNISSDGSDMLLGSTTEWALTKNKYGSYDKIKDDTRDGNDYPIYGNWPAGNRTLYWGSVKDHRSHWTSSHFPRTIFAMRNNIINIEDSSGTPIVRANPDTTITILNTAFATKNIYAEQVIPILAPLGGIIDHYGVNNHDWAISGGYVDIDKAEFVISSPSIVKVIPPTFRTLKSNSKLNIGLLYKDSKGRSIGATDLIKLETGKIGDNNTPVYNVVAPDFDFKQKLIQLSISHQPPIDAVKYSVVVSKSMNISDYVMMVANNVVNAPSGAPLTSTFELGAITDLHSKNENCIIEPWTFEKGDKVRFIADMRAINDYDYQESFDVEILSCDTTGEPTYSIGVASGFNSGDIVEVYRLNKFTAKDEARTLYELKSYPIDHAGTDGRTHMCGRDFTTSSGVITYPDGFRDQTLIGAVNGTHPAMVTLDYGDAYLKLAYQTTPSSPTSLHEYVRESEDYSDYYSSKYYGLLKPFLQKLDPPYDETTMLRFGGKLAITDSNQHISEFNWDDFTELSPSYGEITAIRMIGFTVVVFQERKVTSFYVNKTSLKEADGGEQIVLSDNVLANKNVSEFDYGCIHQESIIKLDTHILFFDYHHGRFVRHSKNGMIDISAYGISSFSNSIMKTAKVVGSYHKDLVYWMIDNGNGVNTAVSFNDKKNEWRSFYNFNDGTDNVEMVGRNLDNMSAFINGNIFYFGSGVLNNLFTRLGSPHIVETIVEKVINVHAPLVKVFDYLIIVQDFKHGITSQWLPNEEGDVSIDGGKQLSRIRYMPEKEGRAVSEFKRNIVYPSGGFRPDENSGEVLRGNACTIRLRISPIEDQSEQIRIISITAGVTLSEKID